MKVLLAGILLATLLVACDQNTPNPVISGNTPFPEILPTPLPSKGTVTGRIKSADPNRSPSGISVYFGTLLPVTPGPDYLINVDPQNSPKAYVYEDGRFVMPNITPGRYAMILWAPHDSRFIPDPANSKKELIVNVVSGQILELGTLIVELPR